MEELSDYIFGLHIQNINMWMVKVGIVLVVQFQQSLDKWMN